MRRMTLKEIEEWVDNVEELYWWGMSYCKEHRCNVRQFIKDHGRAQVGEKSERLADPQQSRFRALFRRQLVPRACGRVAADRSHQYAQS